MAQNESMQHMLNVAIPMGKLARHNMLKRGASFSEIRELDEHITKCEKDLEALTQQEDKTL